MGLRAEGGRGMDEEEEEEEEGVGGKLERERGRWVGGRWERRERGTRRERKTSSSVRGPCFFGDGVISLFCFVCGAFNSRNTPCG